MKAWDSLKIGACGGASWCEDSPPYLFGGELALGAIDGDLTSGDGHGSCVIDEYIERPARKALDGSSDLARDFGNAAVAICSANSSAVRYDAVGLGTSLFGFSTTATVSRSSGDAGPRTCAPLSGVRTLPERITLNSAVRLSSGKDVMCYLARLEGLER
jgi:hypothetical protein